ncbi:MAG: S8 family peptidase [Candidatus Kapabacteria bacterium]|nr:S8 family peptidase [Candidatus Kapabacteria bacterium]
MRNVFRALTLVTTSLVFVSCSMQQDVTNPNADVPNDGKFLAAPQGYAKVPDEYIIVFKDSKVAKSDVEGKAKGLANKHGLKLGYTYETAIRGFSAFVPPGILKKLEDEDVIERIEEDYTISVGPVQEYGKNTGGTTPYARVTPEQLPWGVSAVWSTKYTSTTRPSTPAGKAWIIDTGIDPNHPDLNVDKTGLNKNFVIGGGQSASTWQDKNGHGTHVAGTIAAKADGFDVIGVAPGATVVAVRCLDSRGSGQYSWIIKGIDYVAGAANPTTDVCNMSLGGPTSTTLNTALTNAANKGIKFALAAGNEQSDCTNTSPAGVNGATIWTISAHTNTNTLAYFSNFGAPVDFSAPGVDVVSTRMGGGLTTMSGTSMASPHVAGILLLGPIASRGTLIGDKDAWPDPLARVAL